MLSLSFSLSRPSLLLSTLLLFTACPAFAASTFEQVYAVPSFTVDKLGSISTPLIRGIDGSLYGGGFQNAPVIYKVVGPGQSAVVWTLPYDATVPRPFDQGNPVDVIALVQAPDGTFYGALNSYTDGINAALFKVDPAGVYSELGVVSGYVENYSPLHLTLGSDGALYGVTSIGGVSGEGDIFRVPAGGQVETLVTFNGENGDDPDGGMLLAQDGNLYGTTQYGGSSDAGTLFKLTPAGVFTTLHSFTSLESRHPITPLVQRANGEIYGITNGIGGAPDNGAIYELNTSGGFSVVQRFPTNLPLQNTPPNGGLTLGTDDCLYGTTGYGGGTLGGGTIFRYDFAGNLKTLGNFSDTTGAEPTDIIQGANGNFYGRCFYGGNIYEATPGGVVSRYLDPVRLPTRAGLNGVAQATDGTLYGTTTYGGDQLAGTAFKISPTGTPTTLSSFTGQTPQGALQAKPDGDFYGTTASTALANSGSLFTMNAAGATTTVATASSSVLLPARVVLGADGNYYGALNSIPGSIVQITPAGVVSAFHTFSTTDGSGPDSLIAGTDGLLYGATAGGGAFGAGTVFSLTTGGTLTTLASFHGDAGGGTPSGLVRMADGTLYGVTERGNTGFYYGAIFKFSGGTLSIVRGFGGADGSADGGPPGSLTAGDDGALYGLLSSGGVYGSGALFRIAANGDYIILHHFDRASGTGPAQLSRGVDGNLYGVTSTDGAAHGGTVFRVRIGDGPTPFESWLASGNLTSGPNGDDDQDGLSNLLEYATGTDPQVAHRATAAEQGGVVLSHGALAVRYGAGSSTGQNAAIFARRKDYAASNLTYAVQYSVNLTTWNSLAVAPKVIASDADVEILSVGVPVFSGTPLFYRLQVLAP